MNALFKYLEKIGLPNVTEKSGYHLEEIWKIRELCINELSVEK